VTEERGSTGRLTPGQPLRRRSGEVERKSMGDGSSMSIILLLPKRVLSPSGPLNEEKYEDKGEKKLKNYTVTSEAESGNQEFSGKIEVTGSDPDPRVPSEAGQVRRGQRRTKGKVSREK